jgi:predicted Rossmann fold flavoprotein
VRGEKNQFNHFNQSPNSTKFNQIQPPNMHIVVIGGGAAGFFAAITCAEAQPDARVTIVERGASVLQKVKISGGGRCNVTHACFDARELVQHYPRGSRELLGPFLRFGPSDTVAWFEARGVRLKAEADGRMFPVTDSSQTIVECLWQAARQAGVVVQMSARVEGIFQEKENRWRVEIARAAPLHADAVLVAAGSSESVWQWLGQLGHRVVPPVPSLFTFNVRDPRLQDLAGVSVPSATVEVADTRLRARGPLLVTHWGLSGPAILRLSAWGARDLHDVAYAFSLKINWLGDTPLDEVLRIVQQQKTESGKKQVAANPQCGLPTRLWQRLVAAAGIGEGLRWADLDKKNTLALATELCAGTYAVRGKSTFKEEFVTAGGVDLREVNFKTFESKLHPGLYFAGEVLDVDAITGGFNFQAAWTGGFIAGHAMAGSERQ